jgi:hypothetical protein
MLSLPMELLTPVVALLFAFIVDKIVSIDNSRICARMVPIPEDEEDTFE